MIPLIITKIAHIVGISSSLLYSVCYIETGLRTVNNYADGHGGSYGQCQLNLSTARAQLSYIDLLALQQRSVNYKVAALYLKKLRLKYGNTRDTVAAYNAGTVRIKNNNYTNYVYVDKVMNIYYKVEDNIE
jgi:hypothetical protein